ncbi:hypothetical protein [Antarcticirhabdus aurantiaca]|uniref:Uncharacterized protein n=1 Tax=Antarcticirhabdus aurantiaca TaxID=2606717 RepID=A0ACD4NJ73_9HYPH|nr:hypothetical protein OXU80_18545 [Jeongeuplla avenae]
MSDTETGETVAMALPASVAMVADAGAPAIPESFDAARRYEVTFAAVVDLPPFRYGPRDGALLMKGGVLNRIRQEKGADVFRSAVAR